VVLDYCSAVRGILNDDQGGPLHPSGLPHGPQPGAVEKALGAKSTDELAIMWDTFRPLHLSTLWRDNDKPEYALSWNPDRSWAHV